MLHSQQPNISLAHEKIFWSGEKYKESEENEEGSEVE